MLKIKKIFQKIFKSKKIVLFFALFLFLGIFVVGNPTRATLGGDVGLTLGWIIYPVVALIMRLMLVLFKLLTAVCQYNDFINAAPVIAGWVIVRDVCNMFFILILLVIAFATILRVEGYDVKKMIPKLIIMAVLINFSKTICGLIIDAANIVMNTFVNSFKDMVGGNLTTMLGLPDMFSLGGIKDAFTSVKDNDEATLTNVVGSLVLSLIFSLVALVVTVVLLAVLVVRMVMIWIYVVLSPLAYLLSTFPQGKKYASQWWDDFTKNVITGPILAFFIWLAFISAQGTVAETTGSTVMNSDIGDPTVGLSGFGTPDTMLKFVISVGMLMGGLIIAQQAGGAIGKIAGSGMAKIQGGANWFKKNTVDKATTAVATTGKNVAAGAGHIALAGGKLLDRLPGAMLGDNKLGRGIAQHGVVGGALSLGKNTIGNVGAFFGRKIDQNYDINKTRVNGRGKDVVRHTDGHDYKLNENKDGKKVYQQYDKEKGEFIGDVNDKNYTLNKKNFSGEEEAVGEMGGKEAMFHTAVWGAGSVARAARFDAEEKSAEEDKKKIVRFDDDQLHALLGSITSSKSQKRAAAETLAERGKFTDNAEIQKARTLYGTNGKALGDFNEKLNIKQAHKAYNFDDTKDVERFHGDIAKGKVDMGKFDSGSLKEENVMRAMEGFYGNDLPEQLKKIGARALSKKDKDNVDKAYETASRMHVKDADTHSAAAKSLLADGRYDESSEMEKKAVASRQAASKMAGERAKFSGKTEEAFKIESVDGKFETDVKAAGEFFKKSKPRDFDEIDVDNIEKLISKAGMERAGKGAEMKGSIAKNMNIGALKKLISNGEKPELTEYLTILLADNGRKDEVEGDKNLKGIWAKVAKERGERLASGIKYAKEEEQEDAYSSSAETHRL